MRYFTPGFEMDLCGHGTVGTLYALREKGLLEEKSNLTIETKAGILPIQIGVNENGETFIKMGRQHLSLKNLQVQKKN